MFSLAMPIKVKCQTKMLSFTFIRALRNFHFFKQKNMVSGKQQVFVIANNNANNNNNDN